MHGVRVANAGDYYCFGNAIKNLKWRVWSFLSTLDVTDEERQQLGAQLQWMRDALQKCEPYEGSRFTPESIHKLNSITSAPFCPVLRRPLSNEDFAAVQEAVVSGKAKSHTHLVHSILGIVGTLATSTSDGEPVLPFEADPVTRIQIVYNYQLKQYEYRAWFKSERPLGGYQRSVTDWKLAKVWSSVGMWIRKTKVRLPAAVPITDPDERLKEINEGAYADFGVDLEERSLVSFRGTRMALLDTHDQVVSDAISDDALRERLRNHSADSLELSPFFDGDPDDVWSSKVEHSRSRGDAPLVVVEDPDGNLAVLAIESIYQPSSDKQHPQRLRKRVTIRIRHRPIEPVGYLNRIGVHGNQED